MTTTDLSTKITDKAERLSELDKSIKAIEAEISDLNKQKQNSVKSGDSETALEIVKTIRAIQDELEILCQVRDNVKSTSAITQSEIVETWSGISADIRAEFDNKVYPELQDAFKQYCQAVEAVVTLRQKAHVSATQLDRVAKFEGVSVKLPTPFVGVSLNDYYPKKSILEKLNCVTDGGVFYNPITSPTLYN